MSRVSELEDELERSRIIRGATGFFSEFWKFAAKGNIFDLAIGVILGTAFSAIVNSLVADVIMPLLSLLTGNINFAELSYTIRPAIESLGIDRAPVVLNYGKLIQAGINFLVVGLSIFVFYKLITRLRERVIRREQAEEKAAPPDPISTQEKLLCEIRDLLKEQNQRRKE